MSYTVFARKYRPQTFKDLVGQEHVARTLGNAISADRVAHAFLFTGVRGVGKTTSARILAKALNCAEGPTDEPCGVCDSCTEIAKSVSLDVLEMDGASNNSVDDVRRLQESLPYRPSRDRFKVVIVDEVHMLSTGAFNAFLKTLEEPPEHVKFIFATTEAHKVPVTIRSRCQRYDFRLIAQDKIAQRVAEILAEEGVKVDALTLRLVAREAAGSMRDALTLLDQIVAFAGTELTGSEVAGFLGIADRTHLHDLLSATLRGEAEEVLTKVNAVASQGLDLLHFTRALVDLVRDLVVMRVSGKQSPLVSLMDAEREGASALAEEIGLLELQRAFRALSVLVDEVARSSMPRMNLEMGLVRIATRPPLRPLGELVARMEAMERRGGSGASGGGRSSRVSAPPGGSSGPLAPGASAGTEGAPAKPRLSPKLASSLPAKEEEAPLEGVAPEVARVDEARDGTGGQAPRSQELSSAEHEGASSTRAVERGDSSESNASVGDPARAALEAVTKMIETGRGRAPGPALKGLASPEKEVRASDSPRDRSAAVGGPATASLASRASKQKGEHERDWSSLVALLAEEKPALSAVMLHAVPRQVSREGLVLAFQEGSFFGQQAATDESQSALLQAAKRVLGDCEGVQVLSLPAGECDLTSTLASQDEARRQEAFGELRREALEHPLVVQASELFGASGDGILVRVEGEQQ